MDYKNLTPQNAAVVVLHELSTDSLVLTQRSKTLRAHPGEICFPGGRWQVGDKSLYDTALRELEEELGIISSRIQLQKSMRPEQTLTGFIIHPWFASIDKLFPYQADRNEVDEVFFLPLSEVVKKANYREIQISRSGFTITTYQFIASGHYVWGATARIMMQLLSNSSSSA